MVAFSNHKKTGDISVPLKQKKEKINGTLMLYPESPAVLQVSLKDTETVVSAGEVQYAREHPMEEARIRQQMEKLGNTEFVWDSLDIQSDGNIFVPVKVLNELRRTALAQLEQEFLEKYKREAPEKILRGEEAKIQPGVRSEDPLGIYASCEKPEQAEVLMNSPEITGLYLPFDVMETCMEQGLQKEKELYLSLPRITRGKMPEEYRKKALTWLSMGMKGFLVRNLEAYGMLREEELQKYCVADASLYTWNDEACAFWKDEGILRNTVPLELNEKELRHRTNRDSEFIIYGYIPLMLSAQCVRKNTFQCDRKEAHMVLKDRYDKEFPCACVCYPWKTGTTDQKEFCYNIIYNSIPYGLLNESQKVKELKTASLRLSFTLESAKETKEIVREFLDVYVYGKKASAREFTKGHFKRGAE